MVRAATFTAGARQCSPHPRGDGPCLSARFLYILTFSPPAWGWSDVSLDLDCELTVLPTRVGMVRSYGWELVHSLCSPHPRGDGPISAHSPKFYCRFSPPAWGWSDLQRIRIRGHPVLPTRVGMVRRNEIAVSVLRRSPHPRGDGPLAHTVHLLHCPFSPPAWGWSVSSAFGELAKEVLPTRVGMVRFGLVGW